MPDAIDVCKGVMVKKHRAGGFYVYMYLQQPGVYLNAFGKDVPAVVAAKAGFDTQTHAKQRKRQERMAEAMTAIEADLDLISSQDEETVLGKLGEYRVVLRGVGRADVMDGDDNRLTPRPIPKDEAMVLLEFLGQKDKVEEKLPAEKPKDRQKGT